MLRSRFVKNEDGDLAPKSLIPACVSFQIGSEIDSEIQIIAHGSRLPFINKQELKILRAKQAQLRKSYQSIEEGLPQRTPFSALALASTLIFAQYEAGTAVSLSSNGDQILTCSHCFGESEVEWRENKRKWLLYYTGQAVLVECYRWDATRDLALAKVIAIEMLNPGETPSEERQTSQIEQPVFAFVQVLETVQPKLGTSIICVGQPGRDDLESTNARKTTFNLVEMSHGRYRGLVPGVHPEDCSQIGTLKHDAWTYWGHSGAPLIGVTDGKLIGIHSSWDDRTAMRHGVPAIAIRKFLEEALPRAVIDLTQDWD